MIVVLLAAGAATRMGRPKLLLPIDGRPMIEHVLAAAADWPIVVVAGDDVAAALGSSSLCIVRNATPELGMAHSLRLGNMAVPENEPIAVALADLPDIDARTFATVMAAYDDSIDIVVPLSGGTVTHPVIFGPRARLKIAELPDGDTLKRLRDDPELRRRTVDVGAGGLVDIDTPADYDARLARSDRQVESSP